MDYLIDISSVDSRSDESEERSRACLSRLSKEWRRHQTLRELELAGRADGLADDSFAASTRSIFLQRESVLENQPLTEASKKRSSVLAGVLEQTRRLLKDDPDKRPNSMAQVLVLVPRSFRNGYRAYAELLGHLLQSIVIGVVMGLIFFQVNSSPGDVQSLKTLCLQMAAAMYYLSQTVWIYKW